MADANANSLERPTDLGKSPEAVARRWKLELKLADQREAAWRKKATEIYKTYAPETAGANSFNILWANTETLRQAVYNSLPQPLVKRRYSDEDPLGKAVGEVLTRSLEFAQDTYDFDGILQQDVLSMLLPGRAVSRVRYIPDISESSSPKDDDAQESETYEEIEWEQVICEHVHWDDFRILCAAKTWDAVTAIGFRHRFTRDDCIEKFGDKIGRAVPLDAPDDDEVKASPEADLFKTAEIWEIWDKDQKEVLFICPTYEKPCKTQDDPMGLQGFFPVPRPLYAIENDHSLVPTPLYSQYEQQAKELNRISTRINKLIDGLKSRGIYDSTLTELAQLATAGDNELIPAVNVTALLERGGLEKAIWMMPIETAAAVLKELYAQRDAAKQVIYELTGISDIMRSASDPRETYGAQKIKTQWGTQRLQRLQREAQRYIRDLIRLKAEIIAEKFQPETLEKMTLIGLPHQAQVDQQKRMLMAQWGQACLQARQAGQPQPAPPQFPTPVTWEAVVKALHDDATRTWRVDIETDSTLGAAQDADMQDLRDLLGGITQFVQGIGPAVQAGAIPIEAVKAIIGVVARRARMGSAVEDALDKMRAPAPGQDPAAVKAQQDQQQQQAQLQADAQAQQAKQQHEAQLEQLKAQNSAQIEQAKMQANQAAEQARMQADAQVEQARAEASIAVERAKLEAQFQIDEAQRAHELALKQLEHGHGADIEKYRIDMDYRKAIEVAEIAKSATLEAAQMSAAKQAVQE